MKRSTWRFQSSSSKWSTGKLTQPAMWPPTKSSSRTCSHIQSHPSLRTGQFRRARSTHTPGAKHPARKGTECSAVRCSAAGAAGWLRRRGATRAALADSWPRDPQPNSRPALLSCPLRACRAVQGWGAAQVRALEQHARQLLQHVTPLAGTTSPDRRNPACKQRTRARAASVAPSKPLSQHRWLHLRQ